MDGCIYRTKDGECDLYAEGGKYKAWCDMGNCEGRKMSNADRIRSMTDEELAKWLVNLEVKILNRQPMLDRPALEKDWLEWLQKECE